jgi:hypothetical protein
VPGAGWPAGVYFFGEDVLRVGIIVASELPRDPSTILVRLMAAGPLLVPAIEDLAALEPAALARAIAEPVLLELQHVVRQDPNPDRSEQEFIMVMFKSWEEGKAEARAEGRQEGRAAGYREVLLRQLRVRFGGEVDAGAEQRVAAAPIEQLEVWSTRVLSAATLDELMT